MKKWTFVALLVVGALVLGATVLREPIANAAQSVDANIIGPLDGQGNLKVHEQGTAAVEVANLASDPVPVRDAGPTPEPVQIIFDNGQGSYQVPTGKRLSIQYFYCLTGGQQCDFQVNQGNAVHFYRFATAETATGAHEASEQMLLFLAAGATIFPLTFGPGTITLTGYLADA
jgi:hypothetical protein